ncbi:MAG: nucleotidyl transferase AbiEii/AbiGii toxin family protein [Pseudomonadota bacterium]
MTLSRAELERETAATGFQAEPLEKVARLLELLQSLKSHPFLKDRFALKGGTALNLFWADVPRLSVDLEGSQGTLLTNVYLFYCLQFLH